MSYSLTTDSSQKMDALNMICVMGQSHGGRGIAANSYLEGSYTEKYPAIEQNRNGLRRRFRQFSWPQGIPSHAPEVPGSIHEGGELGYSLVDAYGAAFDNLDLVVACVVGDGEAETSALAASWQSNKFLNSARDGAVLPILHLNGYKIANATILARISREELTDLMRGYGHEPHFVEGDDPVLVHQALAGALDEVPAKMRQFQQQARALEPGQSPPRPRWPVIVLRTPKGWAGPKVVDGKPIEGSWRSHQGPIAEFKTGGHVQQLECWLKSYRPEELFDKDGRLLDESAMLAPTGKDRVGCNPHANGGNLLGPLDMPSFRVYAVAVPKPDAVDAEATRPQRLDIAQLGNGASITALKAGQSIDSSMGLTPGGGVIRGTRSGDLDPGVLVCLMREKKFDAAKLEALVDQHSGLLGISGVSGDMRRLHEVAAATPEARLAIEMFCVSVRKQIAAMIAVLGGLDMLVFTGGICENDPHVRDEICSGLSWIGVSLDDSSNRSASNPVSDGPSRCQVLVLASQEDEQLALHAWALPT